MRITLDGPGMNALSSTLMADLRDQLAANPTEPVLLTGAGAAFSAGLDLREVAGLDADGMVRFLDLLEEVVGALYHHPAPTVAFLNGHAIAGGCVIALACDRRICAPGRARVGLNEVALGLQFPPRTLEVVRRQVPSGSHARVMLEAALYSPEDAVSLGIVDEIGDLDRAEAVLATLSRHPASAYAGTKASLHPPTDVDPTRYAAFIAEVVPAWTSPELKARLLAMLQRG